MSDGATVEEMERQNVGIARRIVEYGRRQGVEISLTGDPTTDLRAILGPGGLPRGYCGEDVIPAMNGRASVRNGLSAGYWRACRKPNRAGGPMTARICI